MNKFILFQLFVASLSWGIIHAQLDVGFDTRDRNASMVTRGANGFYTNPGYTFDNVALNNGQLSTWSSTGSYYYGMAITGVSLTYGFSFYLTTPVVASDRFGGQIFEIDSNFVVLGSVWLNYFNLNNMGGASTYSFGSFQKVTASIPGGLSLNPNKYYYFSLWAVSTSRSGGYQFAIANDPNGPGGCWSNVNNMGSGVALTRGGLTFTWELQQTGFQSDITSASSVPTSGGVTTITGSFGNSPVVSIAGRNCPVISASSTTIQCTAPAGSGVNNAISVTSSSVTVTKNIFNYYDVNECLTPGTCPAGYTCVNTYGSYSCNDTNECLSFPCSPFATCANTIGSFTCHCNSGYSGNGFNCSDVNECLSSPCSAHATCTNSPGSYSCHCSSGFSGNGVNCTDINECASAPCDAHATCTNSAGSFNCACNAGLSGNGFNCTDINECLASPCDARATCTNSFGSFSCACNAGSSGDGFSCSRCGENGTKIPAFDAEHTFFSNDSLTLTILIAGNPDRQETVIRIGDSSDPACSFPSASSSSSFRDGCIEAFVLRLPWAFHETCNFEKIDTNPDSLVFQASVYVTTVNTIGEMRGRPLNRSQTDILNVAVSFPKQVTVSAQIRVAAPVALQSQVTRQSFDPVVQAGSAAFVTSLQWPFVLQGGSVTQLPEGIVISASLIDGTENGDCDDSEGSVCFQTFYFSISPSNATCVLDGEYTVEFQVSCRGDDQCPFDGTTYNVQAVLTLQSADFCASLTSSVAVTSSLTSYFDSSKSLQKTSYVVNQTAFFEVVVTSPDSALSSTALSSVVVTQQGHSPVDVTSLYGAVSQISDGADSSSFVLFFDGAYFVVPEDDSAIYDISVTVDIKFSHNDRKRKETTKLRTTTQANQNVVLTKSSKKSSSPSNNNGAKTNVGSQLPYALAALIAAAFLTLL